MSKSAEAKLISLPDLVDQVAESQSELSKKAIKEVLSEALDQVAKQLIAGNKIRLNNFGTFQVASRDARTGRNPATGATIEIAASKTVRFTPAKTLKDVL